MKRIVMLAAALLALGACRPEAEESTTAEELLEGEDSVIKAGTVAPDSTVPAAMLDTVGTGDTAVRVDTGVRPAGTSPR
jgi:hypothetical protein